MSDLHVFEIEEVAQALRCSEAMVHKLIDRGELHIIKIGRLTRITPAALSQFIAERAEDIRATEENMWAGRPPGLRPVLRPQKTREGGRR